MHKQQHSHDTNNNIIVNTQTTSFPIHNQQQHFYYPNNNSIPATQITTAFPMHK
jgi:hypothetical protein